MLLWPFVVLTSFGLVVFLLGAFNDYTGIAAIGAVLIIAVGGGVALTDLETRTDKNISRTYGQAGNEPVLMNSTASWEHEEVALIETFGGPTGHLSFGGIQMLIGGLLLIHILNEVE